MTEHELTTFARRPARALIPLFALGLLLMSGEAEAIMVSEQPDKLHNVGDSLLASRDDCESDAVWTWTFSDVTTNDSIEVWAAAGGSADCSLVEDRNNSGSCFPVIEPKSAGGMTTTVTVGVDVLAGAAYASEITDCVESGTGNVTRPTTLYFLVNQSSGDVPPEDVYSAAVTLDFIGPAAATMNSLSPLKADALNASWSGVEDAATYTLFCAEATAGSEEGGDSDAMTCAASTLTPGELPPAGGCGDSSGTNGEATGLTEGTLYAVGVAAVDNINNPGFLSNVVCATPEPVIGFYDTIGDVDSLCTVAAVPSTPTRWGWVVASLGVAAIGLGRRRRGAR